MWGEIAVVQRIEPLCAWEQDGEIWQWAPNIDESSGYGWIHPLHLGGKPVPKILDIIIVGLIRTPHPFESYTLVNMLVYPYFGVLYMNADVIQWPVEFLTLRVSPRPSSCLN